jgi:hypothetical protein
MSKLVKIFAVLLVIAGTIAVTPRPAEARWGHGGWGHHWGGGWGHHWGGWGYRRFAYYPRPYYYAVPYYYAPRRFVRIHFWRHRHWGWRRHWW